MSKELATVHHQTDHGFRRRESEEPDPPSVSARDRTSPPLLLRRSRPLSWSTWRSPQVVTFAQGMTLGPALYLWTHRPTNTDVVSAITTTRPMSDEGLEAPSGGAGNLLEGTAAIIWPSINDDCSGSREGESKRRHLIVERGRWAITHQQRFLVVLGSPVIVPLWVSSFISPH